MCVCVCVCVCLLWGIRRVSTIHNIYHYYKTM